MGFSSAGSYWGPPTRLAYSLDLKSESRTITGLPSKAAARVEMPSASLSTKKLTGSS